MTINEKINKALQEQNIGECNRHLKEKQEHELNQIENCLRKNHGKKCVYLRYFGIENLIDASTQESESGKSQPYIIEKYWLTEHIPTRDEIADRINQFFEYDLYYDFL